MNIDWGSASAILLGFMTVAGALYATRAKLPGDQMRALQDTLDTLTKENGRLRTRVEELERRERTLLEKHEQTQAELRRVYERIGRAVIWHGELLPEGME